MSDHTKALRSRSLGTIKNELVFLHDLGLLTPQQVTSILSQLPPESAGHTPLREPSQFTPTVAMPPSNQLAQSSLNEKQNGFHNPTPSPLANQPPPPAYISSCTAIATANVLYEYNPSDAGDLAIQPNDRISITEYMNADWAKGRNERTGQEGIFPRSYVSIIEEKNGMLAPVPSSSSQQPSNYGNMPLDVSQGGGGATTPGGSKMNENGKKFGKKLGNAAIFGAGASIGGNIVNSIF